MLDDAARVALAAALVVASSSCGGGDRRGADGGIDAGRTDGGLVDAGRGSRDVGPRRDAPEPTCETVTAFAEPLPATLLFQLDTSNSMNCAVTAASCATGDPTPAPDDSRWDVFHLELLAALDALPDGFRVGLMRFPRAGGACPDDELIAEIAPLGGSRDALRAALASLTPDGLSTPTSDAVAYGTGRLLALAEERTFFVLATDGDNRVCLGCDPGCSFDALDRDNDAMVEAVRAAAASGVPTFVIGVPGARGFRSILSRMASAAGTARSDTCRDSGPEHCHHDLTDPGLDFAASLRAALAAIGEAVLACEYEIPDNPDGAFDPMKVNVELTAEDGTTTSIPRDPSRAAGWDYSDDGARIELHGVACEAARTAARGRIDILFGCPTILI